MVTLHTLRTKQVPCSLSPRWLGCQNRSEPVTLMSPTLLMSSWHTCHWHGVYPVTSNPGSQAVQRFISKYSVQRRGTESTSCELRPNMSNAKLSPCRGKGQLHLMQPLWHPGPPVPCAMEIKRILPACSVLTSDSVSHQLWPLANPFPT
jgi:hypothetical protein